MVLNPKTTSIAYRCPSCGYTVRGIAGAFGLGTQDMLRLRCSCGAATEMTIVGSADRRIRLTVPCLLCNSNHHYTLSDTLFYGKDVFHPVVPTFKAAWDMSQEFAFLVGSQGKLILGLTDA